MVSFVGYLYKAVALQKSPIKFTISRASIGKGELCERLLQCHCFVKVSHIVHPVPQASIRTMNFVADGYKDEAL